MRMRNIWVFRQNLSNLLNVVFLMNLKLKVSSFDCSPGASASDTATEAAPLIQYQRTTTAPQI